VKEVLESDLALPSKAGSNQTSQSYARLALVRIHMLEWLSHNLPENAKSAQDHLQFSDGSQVPRADTKRLKFAKLALKLRMFVKLASLI